MNFKEYISYVFKEDLSDSPYQYKAKYHKEFYRKNSEILDQELRDYFASWLYTGEAKKSQRFAFLDYHMDMYAGEGMDFWDFVKSSPGWPYDPGMDDFTRVLFMSIPETGAKVEWLKMRQEEAYSRRRKPGTLQAPPPEEDHRLSVMRNGKLVDESEVKEWFRREMLLKAFNDEPIISLTDFKTFLHAGFANFKETATVPADQKLEVNADGAFLKNLMFRFYKTYRADKRDKPFREGLSTVLKKTFNEFEFQEVDTIYNSLSRKYMEGKVCDIKE
ncbi:hypothetical protein [Pontibacter pamirensis]|uniref:hypothetical protein n=1 Tax=Pontibacter pamirensis TaxID=2562824 RepID=UPI001389BFED|nr:hypothetical protein [Pontibacter pamirensis]